MNIFVSSVILVQHCTALEVTDVSTAAFTVLETRR